MSAADAHELLRADLLAGRRIAVAGRAAAEAQIVAAAAAALLALGARVVDFELPASEDAAQAEAAARDACARAVSQLGGCDVLIVDGDGLFGDAGGASALLAGPAECWNAARAAAELAFLPDASAEAPPGEAPAEQEGPASPGGRILFVAPARGEHAAAAVAALENLARTLSIEWARHGITTVALAPGEQTAPDAIATLLAYLCSPAGDYFSGCLLDMRGPAGEQV